MVFLAVALIIYKKKCVLNESRMNEIIATIDARKAEEAEKENADEEVTA